MKSLWKVEYRDWTNNALNSWTFERNVEAHTQRGAARKIRQRFKHKIEVAKISLIAQVDM